MPCPKAVKQAARLVAPQGRYNGRNALVAVYYIGDKGKASRFGVVRLDGYRLIELEEKPAKPKSSLVATAIYVLPPSTFPLLSQYCAEGERDHLGNFITYLIDRDEVRAYLFANFWADIGTIRAHEFD